MNLQGLFMRIAFLSPFNPYRGGIAQFSDSLYQGLKAKSDMTTYTFKRLYPKIFFPGTSQYVSSGDNKKDINAERVLDSINPFSYYVSARKISEYKPELLLLSYWMPFFAISLGTTAYFLKKKGIKVIAIMHNVIPHEGRIGDKFLTKYFSDKCNGFVVLNNKTEEELKQIKPDAKYIVSPHPMYDHFGEKPGTAEALKQLDIPNNKKVILFFGLIREYKGLELLIEAMKELGDEYILLIAGEVYTDFKKYQKIIDDNNLQNRIRLHTRYIPDKEVPVYFSAADVCVLPYRTATQSGITGMAYHFEVPLIVSNAGGLSETVKEDKTGIVLTELSSSGISKAIRKFFDYNLKTEFQENMMKYKSKYSWDSLAGSIIEFYKTL